MEQDALHHTGPLGTRIEGRSELGDGVDNHTFRETKTAPIMIYFLSMGQDLSYCPGQGTNAYLI